jgi:hypothetical protein
VPTTFVLGAGASRDAGYPFAKEMGQGLLTWMEAAQSEGLCDFSASASYLRETFADAEDLESLLDQMDQVTNPSRHSSLDKRMLAARVANADRPALIHGLRRWFEQIDRESPNSSYRLFAETVIQPDDTVITFNYDVSLDKELKRAGLWEVGDGYGFEIEGLATSSRVSLLKLHGSINWRALLFGGRRGAFAVNGMERSLGSRPVLFDYDLKTLGYDHAADTRLPRNQDVAAIDSMILPLHEKQFFFRTSFGDEWTSFWDSLWSSAELALRKSDRIIICGYSLLPIDERACKMLLEDEEVTAPFEVCCGSDSEAIVERLRTFGHHATVTDHAFFADWVTATADRLKARLPRLVLSDDNLRQL